LFAPLKTTVLLLTQQQATKRRMQLMLLQHTKDKMIMRYFSLQVLAVLAPTTPQIIPANRHPDSLNDVLFAPLEIMVLLPTQQQTTKQRTKLMQLQHTKGKMIL